MEFIKRDIKKQNRNGELSPTTISYISSIGGSNEVGGNYLPAIDNGDGTYTVDLTQVTFNGNLLATGEVTAYKSGESGGGGGGSVTVYDGLDSTDKTIALSANQGRILKGLIDNIDVGGIDLSGYLPTTGGTLTGKLMTQTSAYYADDNYGINLCNSDIVGVNSLYFNDLAQDNAEGIAFARTNGNWDILRAENGVLKFAPDYVFNSGTKDAYTIWHNGNFAPANYLPLSGGTLRTDAKLVMQSNVTTGNYIGSSAWQIMAFSNSFQIKPADYGTTNFSGGLTLSKGGISYNDNQILHSSNYSDYALPITGGTITNQGTGLFINRNQENKNPHICFKVQGTNVGDIGINYDGTKPMWYSYKTNTWNDIITSDNLSNYTVSNSTKFNGYSLRGAYGFSHNHIDANIMYHLNLTALSSSNFYPVIFSGTQKDLYCNVYSEGRSGGQAWNMNKLEFTFRGQGWCDTPKGITVYYYDCYDSSETTIGCVGMGAEQGNKVLWLRGGLNYYMISNITPSLKTSTYTDTNEVFSVGTGFAGGTNSKVTLYWTPQSTSPLKALYHSGSIYSGGGIQIDGGSRFKSNLTVNGSLTVDTKIETPNQWVNSLTYRNTHCVEITKIGWYRFAVSTAANNAGGTYIFSIKRNYHNTNNEAYLIAATVDFSGGCQFVQLSGHYNTQLISQIRCTYDANSTMYFDFYYNSTTLNKVTVNCIGDAYTQVPTLTTSTLAYTNAHAFVDGIKLGTKSAYQMTLYRNAASGGSYIMYGANNQLTKSWAAGSDGQHRFGWYYKDTSAGTDVEKMWLDSNAVLNFETGVSGRRMTIEGKSGANCFYATTGTNGWTMGNYYYTNAGSILGSVAAYGQGDNFQYYFIGKGYSDTNTIKFYNTGNISSSCWGINNVSTNPNFNLVHNGVNWYLQGYNGYLYLGAGYTKSFRIDTSGNCLSVGELTAHSDRRLKSNIKPLEVRGELNPVTYTKDGKESIGFIADEVKEIYPELVITDDSTEDKYLSLNYAQLTAVLYAEIKELKERIKKLENK